MESKIIKVGTSLGMIIPKVVANEFGFNVGTNLNIKVQDNSLLICKCDTARKGWGKSFAKFAESGLEESYLPDIMDCEAEEIL